MISLTPFGKKFSKLSEFDYTIDLSFVKNQIPFKHYIEKSVIGICSMWDLLTANGSFLRLDLKQTWNVNINFPDYQTISKNVREVYNQTVLVPFLYNVFQLYRVI